MIDTTTLRDEELVEYVRTQNQEAYREVILRYQDKIMRYVNSLTKDDASSSDIVQETFIKAFINLNGFDTKRKFSSWIYRIAHNQAMNYFSAHHRHEIVLPDDLEIASDEDIEAELVQREITEEVRGCLAELPIHYAEPLTLFFIEDKSYEEISDIMRLPIGTVGTRINRAKNLVKKICQKKKIK